MLPRTKVNTSAECRDSAARIDGETIATFTELEAELRGPHADPIRQALQTYMTGLEQELQRHARTRLRPREYEVRAAAVEAVAAAKAILAPAHDETPGGVSTQVSNF
jgi:hypothetical protein